MSRYFQPAVIGRIARIGFRAGQPVEGSITGQHRSPLHGLSAEFADFRTYTPGDDLKHLDWRAYARSDRYYIKRFEEESNLRCWLIVDDSASMNYGPEGERKYDIAATAAVSLAAVLLKQRDAVGLATAGSKIREELRPSGAQSQLIKLEETLTRVTPGGETDLGAVVRELADRIPRRGLVVICSDLFTDLDHLYEALGRLQYGGHAVVLLHILHRDEAELPFNDSVIFRDIEGSEELFAEPWSFRTAYQQAIEQFCGEVRERCQYCGIDYVRLLTDEDLGLALSRYLADRQHRGPAKHRGRMGPTSPASPTVGGETHG
ncbi:MAG: DUF58 domain-containing protein [Planctomyces sp.]|nr:DUF58 domain-containing protein [Planctomyces sp.]